MPMRMFKLDFSLEAVIFDRDFTILRTAESSYRTIEEIFRLAGKKAPDRLFVKAAWATATTDREFWEIIIDRTKVKKDLAWFEKSYRRIYPKFLRFAQPYPDAKPLLQKLRNQGIKIAMVSALPSKNISVEILTKYGIINYFDEIVTVELVKRRLDIYRADHLHRKLEVVKEALRRLNATSSKTLMVGDTIVDIRVGKQLHMPTAVLIRLDVVRNLLSAKPDFFMVDLKELISVL